MTPDVSLQEKIHNTRVSRNEIAFGVALLIAADDKILLTSPRDEVYCENTIEIFEKKFLTCSINLAYDNK